MKKMLKRLLSKNVSPGQIIGYALASLVGLTIVLTAIQFYRDVDRALGGGNDPDNEETIVSRDYLIISKQVSALNALGKGASTTFSEDEIAQIESQPWVRSVGEFAAANFNIYGSVNFQGQGLQSYLFFEAIPDRYLDILPEQWSFNPENPEIPLIISKDYLTLYNFGFAASRGMPQLSESLMTKVPLTIVIYGNGHHQTFSAHIVGFSSRLNTIAVPYDFMEWANQRFGTNEEKSEPSRLIIEVNTPGDPAIREFLQRNDYESAGDKVDNGRASYFLTVVTGAVIAVGAIISILAFFILLLSIYLLLQKNRHTMTNLMLLGYTPSAVSQGYFRMVGLINLGVLILSIILMLLAKGLWTGPLKQIDVNSTSPVLTIVIGVLIMGVITALNYMAIIRTIRSYFK